MPGGSMAIKEPWRMALAYLFEAFGDKAHEPGTGLDEKGGILRSAAF